MDEYGKLDSVNCECSNFWNLKYCCYNVGTRCTAPKYQYDLCKIVTVDKSLELIKNDKNKKKGKGI